MHPCRWRTRVLARPIFALALAVAVCAPFESFAQNAAVSMQVDPRLTADAARCLAIDQELAELAQQFRAGHVTAAERTRRVQALNAERRQIVAAHGAGNSPSGRALRAEFNRLRSAQVAEARERAAAEARQKREAAAADQAARRDAAEKEAQAVRDRAELELKLAVEQVAEERSQRERDRFYRDFGLPAPTVSAAASEASEHANATRERYVGTVGAAAFDRQVEARLQELRPRRTQEWFAEVFPAPAAIVSQVSGDTEATAALELATRRLAYHTPEPRVPTAQAKLEAYQAARTHLKPDFTEVIRLTQNPEFEAKVFARSLPAYAEELRQNAARNEAVARVNERQRRANQMSNFGVLAMMLVGAWWPIRLMRRKKFRWQRKTKVDWEAQVAQSPLPRELWWVDVPGFRYPVTLLSGRVVDKEVWTETTTTTTVTQHATPDYGYGRNYHTTTSTHYSTTVYHRYWLITTEGKRTWLKYSDNEFIATVGQKISTSWSDDYWVLLSGNHQEGTVVSPGWWTKAMHRPPYWSVVAWTAGVVLAVAAAGVMLFTRGFGMSPEALAGGTHEPSRAISALLFVGVPMLLVYVAVVRAVITFRRQRHFRKHVLPKYEAFLREYDPVIPEEVTA